ncbi:PepSY-associated TM helix domain-containing protein [Robiginitalea sp. SC105]|uniref:PepSY-associated TM helix domain-containing protein n=1 Tax=Robiginitalea sp. SC105 TaxID=2762332 RepID=UPI00163AA594|nr:PepSY-associated TM helix domain-containing protein [Robiginitalea sp. SC105]MBC2838295.1 PepSY domain-containing protein [Robiginitalea sp. SC105]
MSAPSSRQKQANTLRVFRKIHRYTGAFLFMVFFFIAVSGLLLGWKKHTGDVLLAKTRTGSSANLAEWKPMAELRDRAVAFYRDSLNPEGPFSIDRIDVRPGKGVVKFTFETGFWGLQLDGATGEVLHVERRRSDIVEKLHDGSMVDTWFGIENGGFKLFYTSLSGVALLVFTITGFWLWYGPKRMRRQARK